MKKEIKFKCLREDCNFTAKVLWPQFDGSFVASFSNQTPLTKHHINTRINLSEQNGLGSGHGKFLGTLPNGKTIKVECSGDANWVVEGFSDL